MNKFLKILKNYYIVFSICFLCVLVTGLLFGVKFYKEQQLKKTALTSPPVVVNMVEENVKKDSVENKTVKNEIINKNIKNEEKSKETMAIKKPDKFQIVMPVSGEIFKSFSMNDLVYSKTFDDYRTHNGIDIKSKRSEAVLAVFDGVVENVYTDPMEGIVIEINHNNGFISIYKNLSSDKMVQKGDTVTKGQAISGVGETAIFEAEDEEHLHFEMKKDNEYVDPMNYFE